MRCCDISSRTTHMLNVSSPPPPYSSGAASAQSPAARVFADRRSKSSSGISGASGSMRCSTGRISSRMKRRTWSRRTRSSSGSVKPGNTVMGGAMIPSARCGGRPGFDGRRRPRDEEGEIMKLIYEVKDRVAYITINRPEVMNAMDAEVYAELSKAWIDVRDNPDVWVAIVTGAGEKAFTAGADLKSFIPRTREKSDFWLTQKSMILNRGLEVWKPVIAAVNGYCLAGGVTLLFATDIRVAADHAVFEIAEVRRGILPGNGGTQRALRQLPYPIAMEMLLLGRRLTAQEALTYGLVNTVVPLKDLMPTAEQYARRLCENGPLALRAVKELAVRSQSLPLEHGIRLEESFQEFLRTTEDAKEGPRAFAEKRKPVYKAQ